MKKGIRLLLLVMTLVGCNGRHEMLSPVQYLDYLKMPSNRMVKVVEAKDVQYAFQLATPEYIACQEFDGRQDGESSLKERLDELKGNLFFIISIKALKNQQVPLNTDQMAIYYGGAVVNDLMLRVGKKELRPSACHFENNLGLSPNNTLVAAFQVGDSLQEDIQLVFNDRYSENFMLQAGFAADQILCLPKLNIR